MTDKAEQIAAGLTEAQRRGLLRVRKWPDEGDKITPIAALNYHSFKALERRGLVTHHITGMVSCALFTPLGLSVREYLERQSDDQQTNQ